VGEILEYLGYWKAVFKDQNGRDTYYVPDDLNNAKNLSFVIRDFELHFPHVKKFNCVFVKTVGGDGLFESTPLSFNLDE
jgi:hypothetical protein